MLETGHRAAYLLEFHQPVAVFLPITNPNDRHRSEAALAKTKYFVDLVGTATFHRRGVDTFEGGRSSEDWTVIAKSDLRK